MTDRRGFAMLITLWVIVIAAIIAGAGAALGREYFDAARYRVEWQRAFWSAYACERRAQAAADATLRDTTADGDDAWRSLAQRLRASPWTSACHLDVEAAGTKLDANGATWESFCRLFSHFPSIGDPESLATAFVLARDTLPFADVRDFGRVKGFEPTADAESVLSVEAGRVSIAIADIAVLASIPGVTDDAARQIIAYREANGPLASLTQLLDILDPVARGELSARFADASAAATADPDAWIVRSWSEHGFPRVRALIAWRLVRASTGIQVARVGSVE